MTKHIMVDLETMGTRPTSAIVSIGAVEFDPLGEGVTRTYYAAVNLDSCIMRGMTMDASTVVWWAKQSDEARKVLTDPLAESLPLILLTFTDWFNWMADPEPTRLWCRGPDFDAVLLDNAYRACSLTRPWRHDSARDVRTVCDLAGLDVKTVPLIGTQHNALDDASHQAVCVQEAYRRLFSHTRGRCVDVHYTPPSGETPFPRVPYDLTRLTQ